MTKCLKYQSLVCDILWHLCDTVVAGQDVLITSRISSHNGIGTMHKQHLLSWSLNSPNIFSICPSYKVGQMMNTTRTFINLHPHLRHLKISVRMQWEGRGEGRGGDVRGWEGIVPNGDVCSLVIDSQYWCRLLLPPSCSRLITSNCIQ